MMDVELGYSLEREHRQCLQDYKRSIEPNNAIMFDSILQFAVKVGPTAKPFGPYDVNTVKFRSQASVLRKPKFWALSLHCTFVK